MDLKESKMADKNRISETSHKLYSLFTKPRHVAYHYQVVFLCLRTDSGIFWIFQPFVDTRDHPKIQDGRYKSGNWKESPNYCLLLTKTWNVIYHDQVVFIFVIRQWLFLKYFNLLWNLLKSKMAAKNLKIENTRQNGCS